MTNKKFGVGRSIKVETKDLIKELRILEKSSKLGEQACICGEAANRLEELLQEIEISRRLEKSENHKENDDRKQLLSKNKKKMEVKKNVLKPLQSFLKSGRKIYITGFDYDEMSYVLDIDDKYLNDFVGDYTVFDFMILDFTFPTTPSNSPLHRGRMRYIETLIRFLASVSPPVQGGVGGGSWKVKS